MSEVNVGTIIHNNEAYMRMPDLIKWFINIGDELKEKKQDIMAVNHIILRLSELHKEAMTQVVEQQSDELQKVREEYTGSKGNL